MLKEDVVYDNGFFYGMSWFGAFRNHYGFTSYSDFRTSVTIDFAVVTVIYFCSLVAVSTLVSTLGIRGHERWSTTLRASYAVGLAMIILLCLVGHNWQEGSTEITTQYIYRTDCYFEGTVGLRVALHGVNVTLKGYYGGPHGGGYVYYAEDLKWADYGKEPEMIDHYLNRGLPHPILTVMDFLSVDEGGLRWGRNFHSAGYFAHALMWTAMAFWVIANVLLFSVVSYGAFVFALTGVTMVISCVVYHVCQPPHDLQIHFGEAVLTTHYGWCFWLALASGIVTTVLGTLLFILDHLFHEKVSEFFNLENLDEDDFPDLSTPSPTKDTDKFNAAIWMCNHPNLQTTNARQGSLQPGQRRSSIFLEPERRPSDTSGGIRRVFTSNQSLGIHNKAFEKERSKSNPLFGSSAATDIKEENEGAEKHGEVRIEIGSDEVPRCGNRKPSLATMREHRENHMNERQQQQTSCAVEDATTPASIIVHCPDKNDVTGDDAVKMTSERAAAMTVGFGLAGDPVVGFGEAGCSHDCSDDSAIASGNTSPMELEKTSTFSDMEEYRSAL